MPRPADFLRRCPNCGREWDCEGSPTHCPECPGHRLDILIGSVEPSSALLMAAGQMSLDDTVVNPHDTASVVEAMHEHMDLNHHLLLLTDGRTEHVCTLETGTDIVQLGSGCGATCRRGASAIYDMAGNDIDEFLAECICYAINEGNDYAGETDGTHWQIVDIDRFKDDLLN